MQPTLGSGVRNDLISRGFTRRNFGRLASVITAGASLPFYNEFALAQRAQRGPMPPDAVRIASNENPLGPCKEACEAVYKIASKAGRYDPSGELAEFLQTAAELEDLKPENVAGFAGSADPLHRTVCAFVSPQKSFVMGDPGYESPGRTAEFIGAKVHRIPLRKDGSHDVKAMVAADPGAGILYICNPNNPTGTLTSKEDIAWLIANKPAGSILLLDEAYIHFSNSFLGSEFVAAGKDVVVLRTFSKAYGMAGLRAGMALGRPDLLSKFHPMDQAVCPSRPLPQPQRV